MQGILHEAAQPWVFLVLTVILGGAAAFRTGMAIAATWRPFALLIPYMVLLTLAVRFLHHALFGGSMLSLHYFFVDFTVLMALASLGWRRRRARQMVAQYAWEYAAYGPLGWGRKPPADAG